MSDNGKSLSIYNQGQRIKSLEQKLIETASELSCMIERENNRLRDGICSTDLDEPDYFDYQTVYEARRLALDT